MERWREGGREVGESRGERQREGEREMESKRTRTRKFILTPFVIQIKLNDRRKYALIRSH